MYPDLIPSRKESFPTNNLLNFGEEKWTNIRSMWKKEFGKEFSSFAFFDTKCRVINMLFFNFCCCNCFSLRLSAPRSKILKNGGDVVIGRVTSSKNRNWNLFTRPGSIDSLWLHGVNTFVLPRRDPSMVPRIICGCGRAAGKALVIFLITPVNESSTRAMWSVEFHGILAERKLWLCYLMINQRTVL